MKYSELVQFEPIESVVVLRHADAEDRARRLVETYVVSKGMGETLSNLVFPQLQFDKPADNRGLLVVGNYGTGKSHLMAVISAVAEHAGLASALGGGGLKGVDKVAGKFRVIRDEIGATTMSLRDIVCSRLEDGLRQIGVKYTFPQISEAHQIKGAFLEMMAAFEARHPKHGLLLVLDELLDYLRSRKEHDLILDFSFLREIGEVCRDTRFRFIGGVQESLFDSGRFVFLADTLLRVKDRFEQVAIRREDIAYVVGERLLKKNAKQQARIREHLQGFSTLYGSLNERLDDYVRLFPVHPAYFETFDRITVAEKREVLKTISQSIAKLRDSEVPQDSPGLLAYDSYWSVLRANPAFKAVPEIAEVMERSQVLEDKIHHAYTKPPYKAAAIRIVHALSVHRLTTGDIYVPIGVTPEELRDDLCLMLPIPEREPEFLESAIDVTLNEILKTVSGQFLTVNPENGQYYIDIKKDIDFDALVEKRGDALSEEQLDRHYFDALRRVVLEQPDLAPYVTGYRIWEKEVDWRERNVTRSGYLFFGAPNERSTAQPARDFYLYFLQPFDPPAYSDERKPDEVFFRLKKRDEEFDKTLRLYGGAREQENSATGGNKSIYADKAAAHLRTLTAWLKSHMATAFEVVHEGRARTLAEAAKGALASGLASATFQDFVEAAASACLGAHFQDRSPDYPSFGIKLTRQSRRAAVQDALRAIATGNRTKNAVAVLDGLELLQGDKLDPRHSRYAKHVTEALAKKSGNQVLNRSELVQEDAGVPYWTRFRLEPEFLAVVLAALVHSGDLVLALPGRKLDAASLDLLVKVPLDEIESFKHAERPRDLPLASLQDLFELLGLAKGLIVTPASREEGVGQLQKRVAELAEKVANARKDLASLVLWGRSILSEAERTEWSQRLASLGSFLDSLQPFNTAAKLKNFGLDSAAIAAQEAGLATLRDVEDLRGLIQQLGPVCSYLSTAEAVLGSTHPWVASMSETRNELLAKLASAKKRADPGFQRSLGQSLAELKTGFQDAYLALHQAARLGANDDKKKAALAKDKRLARLQKLLQVEVMPGQHVRAIEKELFDLKTCFSLTRAALEAEPSCPDCHFKPVEEPAPARSGAATLTRVDDRLDTLTEEWTRTLLANLDDPTVQGSLALMSKGTGATAVRKFRESKALPETIDANFVKALQEALSGLERVVVSVDGLRAALAEGGTPCTVEEIRERFARHIAALSAGRDASRVRIVVE